MSPQEQITAFEAHVKALNKAFDKSKSILKPVFDHLDKQKATKPLKKLNKEEVVKSLGQGNDKKDTYVAALDEICRVWGTADVYKPGSSAPAGVAPLAFARRNGAQLAEFMGYAPADLLVETKLLPSGEPDWRTGRAHFAEPSRTAEVLKRYREHAKDIKPAAVDAKLAKLLTPGSAWAAEQYAKVYEEVKKQKAGTFTQFALASAHVLTANQKDGPRVEIVAFKAKGKKEYAHVYVLVGRTGDDATSNNNKIPPWQSQKEVVIVDGWAAALGHDVAYKGRTDYPFGLIDDLDVIASWPPKPKEEPKEE